MTTTKTITDVAAIGLLERTLAELKDGVLTVTKLRVEDEVTFRLQLECAQGNVMTEPIAELACPKCLSTGSFADAGDNRCVVCMRCSHNFEPGIPPSGVTTT